MAESVVRALYGKATSLNLNSKKMKDVPTCVSTITNLSVLLLNNNAITTLPADLSNLQHLSVLDNKLEEVPAELGHLTKLSEINLTSNKLSLLPQQLCQCKDLTRLHVARNQLTSLPEVGNFSGNMFVLFLVFCVFVIFLYLYSPMEQFHLLPLKELHCEGNRFLHCEPLPSVQDVEVLTLKVTVMEVQQKHRDLLYLSSTISQYVFVFIQNLPHYPCLTALLANSSCCALCLGPFLTTWLECVHFISLKKDMKMRSSLTIPVRALLCSYKCFNTDGHSYYGVATR
uniref:Uncharacterized protein n=1 Tax=Seriola lalandi dorsalis TaxID=1841481 RepID=A0A3B4XQE3_SERLL